MVERYQIFCTVENSKRLKDGVEGTLDLQSYVEFKRNYRAVIRVHKEALQCQRDFWRTLLHSTAKVSGHCPASWQLGWTEMVDGPVLMGCCIGLAVAALVMGGAWLVGWW